MPPLMYPLRHTRLRILSEYLYALERYLAERITHYQDIVGHMVDEEPSIPDVSAALQEFDHLQQDYPRNLRYSFVMMIMGNTEDVLREFCRSHCTPPMVPLKLGAGRQAIKRRLEHLGAVTFTASVWSALEDLANVRNVIAHCGGDITRAEENKREKLLDFASREPEIAMSEETGQILLSKSFCHKALIWVDLLLDEIESGMNQRIWIQESGNQASGVGPRERVGRFRGQVLTRASSFVTTATSATLSGRRARFSHCSRSILLI